MLSVLLLFSGCATTSLPLCPKLAKHSYPNGTEVMSDGYVNKHILDNADRLGIKVHVISPFIAEYRGSTKSISWFRKNYSQMVCAFDPEQVLNDKASHISCTTHVEEWIALLDNLSIPQLLDDKYAFGDNCVK